jgi:hypothetical protein
MTEITDYDRRMAEVIRGAVAGLNAAIDMACEMGIQVSFGVARWTDHPSKSHVANLRIERPSDLRRDYSGETL